MLASKRKFEAMKRDLNLSVPAPCHEKWENFTPEAGGGFCGACKKTVVDFTKMSDRQLLEYLQNKPVHTCGRFRPDQLKTYVFDHSSSVHPGFALLKAGVVGLFVMLAGRPVTAQSIPDKAATEVTQYPENTPEKNSGGMQEREFTFKGIVRINGNPDEPLPGANVLLKGTTEAITADEDGRFVFPRKLKAGDVLVISFIGMITQEYTVSREPGEHEVPIMLMIEDIMGDIVIQEPYTAQDQSGIQKWWLKVKAWF
jgi:hypothetical protein